MASWMLPIRISLFNGLWAEKVLAYAKEHYKEHGIEDYDEDTLYR